MLGLNKKAWNILQDILEDAGRLGVSISFSQGGAILVDAGLSTKGSLRAGLLVSRLLLADMADVGLGFVEDFLSVQVSIDNPFIPCFASQYAGWKISVGDFYGMGSGPARLLVDSEPIISEFRWSDRREKAVLFIETSNFPSQDVIEYIVRKCDINEKNLGVIVAPSNSIVGSIQIASRVVETAMHKLKELGYDVRRVNSAVGISPVAPVGKDALEAVGRANDAIIYGGKVVAFVDDEEDLSEIAKKVPSLSSKDFGKPFIEILESVGRDFYEIDPMLFSPAEMTIISLRSGRVFHVGGIRKDLLRRSFGI